MHTICVPLTFPLNEYNNENSIGSKRVLKHKNVGVLNLALLGNPYFTFFQTYKLLYFSHKRVFSV